MKAAILTSPHNPSEPSPSDWRCSTTIGQDGQVLLRVRACGVCRTDLHIVEGELPPLREDLIPGHQIVGEIVEGGTPDLPSGYASWGFLDWRHRRDVLVLPARS